MSDLSNTELAEYRRAVYALQLELPSAVFDDFKAKSDALLARLDVVTRQLVATTEIAEALIAGDISSGEAIEALGGVT